MKIKCNKCSKEFEISLKKIQIKVRSKFDNKIKKFRLTYFKCKYCSKLYQVSVDGIEANNCLFEIREVERSIKEAKSNMTDTTFLVVRLKQLKKELVRIYKATNYEYQYQPYQLGNKEYKLEKMKIPAKQE